MPAASNTDEIVALIGWSAFRSLVDARGGRRTYIPQSLENSSGRALVQWVGEVAAEMLVDAFGGEGIDVPNLGRKPSKRQQVLDLTTKGLSRGEVADALGITEFSVRRHLKDAGPNASSG